jgi:hypothetical protein
MPKRSSFAAETGRERRSALALPHSRHYLAKREAHLGLARAAEADRFDPPSKGNATMRKIALLAAAGAALSLAACSEKTQDAAATTADSAAADTAANAEAAGDAVTDAATTAADSVDAAAHNAATTAENEAAKVEAEAQGTTVQDAKKD